VTPRGFLACSQSMLPELEPAREPFRERGVLFWDDETWQEQRPIDETVHERIESCRLFVAVMDEPNAQVGFEVGLALAFAEGGKPLACHLVTLHDSVQPDPWWAPVLGNMLVPSANGNAAELPDLMRRYRGPRGRQRASSGSDIQTVLVARDGGAIPQSIADDATWFSERVPGAKVQLKERRANWAKTHLPVFVIKDDNMSPGEMACAMMIAGYARGHGHPIRLFHPAKNSPAIRDLPADHCIGYEDTNRLETSLYNESRAIDEAPSRGRITALRLAAIVAVVAASGFIGGDDPGPPPSAGDDGADTETTGVGQPPIDPSVHPRIVTSDGKVQFLLAEQVRAGFSLEPCGSASWIGDGLVTCADIGTFTRSLAGDADRQTEHGGDATDEACTHLSRHAMEEFATWCGGKLPDHAQADRLPPAQTGAATGEVLDDARLLEELTSDILGPMSCPTRLWTGVVGVERTRDVEELPLGFRVVLPRSDA